MLGLMRLAERRAYEIEFHELNGAPGAIFRQDGEVVGTMALEIGGGRVTAIHSVVNPDKLRHLR